MCILQSHISSLNSLKKLIETKDLIYNKTSAGVSPKEEVCIRLQYGFEGICIQTDAYDSNGTELLNDNICRDDIRINNYLISYGERIRKRREEQIKILKIERGNNMHRIYSNYTDEEFNTIEEEANKAGMTISAFCKAAVIAKVSGKTDNFSIDLIKILHKKLKSLDEGEVFIVSDLYSEEVWTSLSRSEKIPYLNN